MADEIQLRFDYGALDTETRAFVQERAERIHNLARMTAAGIVQIGQYLTEVKERLKHGQFLDWIEREFAWSQQHASRLMHVYEQFKLRNLSNLTIDVSALYLIAAPSTPEPVRTEVIRRAENGEGVTHQGARAIVREFAETGKLPEMTTSLPKLIEERRRLLPPEPPVKKASAAELEEHRKFQERARANSERMTKVMAVIRGVESIAETPLTVAELAKQIARLDTPDKDWTGQARKAAKILTALVKEL